MTKIQIPEFANYEEETEFWDKLDTADFMDDDGEWFKFDTEAKQAVEVAILPEIAERLSQRARHQGVSLETLINVLLLQQLQSVQTV